MAQGKVIRVEEWLAELNRVTHEEPEGFATSDVMRVLGIKARKAGDLMREWHRQGRIEFSGKRTGTAIDGRPTIVPMYRMVKPKR